MLTRTDEVPLTLKQRRFVDAYLGQAAGNGTAAAEQAGYRGSRSSLAVIAAENLRKPHIRAAIDAAQKDDALIANRTERMRFWSKVLRDPSENAVSRLKASELLGKAQGDFLPRPPDPTDDPNRTTYTQLVMLATRTETIASQRALVEAIVESPDAPTASDTFEAITQKNPLSRA